MKASFVLFAALALPLAAAENLLVNPKFEGGKNGVPSGWKVYSTGLAAPKVVTLPDGSAALELDDGDKDKGGGLRQQVVCEPGAKYELSCEALPVEGKEMGRVLLQLSGKNLVLRPGRNTLGITAAKTPLQVFVWTAKPDVGCARVRDLVLKKVDEFGPETAVDGKRPRAAKPAAKPAAAAEGKPAPAPRADEIVAVTDGKQAEFTLPHDGLWEIDAVMTSPRHKIFGAFVRVSMDGGPWCNSMIRNYNPMNRSLSPMMLLWHYKAGRHVLRYNTYDSYLKDQVKIHEFRIHPFRNAPVPEAARDYQPKIVPPKTHPRVLITRETLPRVRENLKYEPNRTIWKKVLEEANKEYRINVPPDKPLGYSSHVCKLVRAKFLAYLLSGEEKYFQSGRKLLIDYLKRLNFVKTKFYYYNHGEMLYSTALAYDWAYDRFTEEEKKLMRDRMDFFAHTMETGYPPFAQHITYGHGNGAQSHSYLPPWAIAIYDENPEPYRWCAYRVLEQLIPQRVAEFSSGRHAEGSSYAIARFKGDLFSALQYRMLNGGKEVFHPNIKDIYMNFIYVRMPDGTLFNNGDNWTSRRGGALCAALAAAYSGNPYYVRDLQDAMAEGMEGAPEQILAWYDPRLKPADFSELPLTRYQPGPFASMNIRTGWNMTPAANDAVIEFIAKENNLAGHSHRDIGSFEIWYRGLLAGDIGQYKVFGVPYDACFAKRTVAHSAMLVYDPQAKMLNGNDGGQRQGGPCLTAAAFRDEEKRFATTLAADYGPVAAKPLYNVLKTDMTKAYPEGRVKKHVRSFYFLNFNDPERPGAVIVADRVEAKFTKYFQVNSPGTPEPVPGGVKITSECVSGMPGHLHVNMLRPQVKPEILSGKAATNVFGKQYTPPHPERPASRTMFPAKNGESDFTCVMQIAAGDALPVASTVSGEAYVIRLRDWTLALADKGGLVTKPFTFDAAGCVLLADLAPGDWTIEGQGYATVEKGKHTLFAKLPKGKYTARPGKSGDPIPACRDEAVPTPALRDCAIVKGQAVPDMKPAVIDGKTYVDAAAVMRAMGKSLSISGGGTVELGGRKLQLDVQRQGGKLLVTAENLGAVLSTDVGIDTKSNVVTFGGHSAIASCIHIASSNGQSAIPLITGKDRWIHNSPEAFFTVRFLIPKMLTGLTLIAASMQDPFVVELSDDGKIWRKAAEGETNALSGEPTEIRFASPQKVDFLRFRFKGSKTHPHWNTLNRLILKE